MDVSVRHFSLLLAALIGLTGCQTTDPSVELLESELRWMEDQLYSLDRQLDQTCLQLASAKNSNRALKRELAQLKRSPDGPSPSPRPETGSAPEDLTPPAVDVPGSDEFDAQDLEVPRIELGPEPVPADQPPPELPDAPKLEENLDDFTARGDVDVQVARIVLNSRLTGGYDFDGRPGDEGLLLVIEPQNAAGQYVPLPGDLEVEVKDPARSGPEGRVARWELDSAETVATLKKSLLGRGMHLQLPWPDHLPAADKLLVTVHFTPPTGGTLTAQRPVRVDVVAGQTTPNTKSSAILPDQFVPSSPPRMSQLLSDQTLAPPSAPLTGSDLEGGRTIDRRRGNAEIPRTATPGRGTRSARARRPQWSPYR